MPFHVWELFVSYCHTDGLGEWWQGVKHRTQRETEYTEETGSLCRSMKALGFCFQSLSLLSSAGEKKKKSSLLFCRLVVLFQPSKYKWLPPCPYISGWFCYLVSGLAVLFFNLKTHGYTQQWEDGNRSISISPCISFKGEKTRQQIMTAGRVLRKGSTMSPCWSAQAAFAHKQLCISSHCHLENVPLSVSFRIHWDALACLCLMFCKACCFWGKSML